MNTKIIIATLFAFVACATLGTAQNTIQKEKCEQRNRIKEGVATGELNRKETRKLAKEQAQIQGDIKVAKSDGIVTHAERKHIKGEQRRASRHIKHEKHDVQKQH